MERLSIVRIIGTSDAGTRKGAEEESRRRADSSSRPSKLLLLPGHWLQFGSGMMKRVFTRCLAVLSNHILHNLLWRVGFAAICPGLRCHNESLLSIRQKNAFLNKHVDQPPDKKKCNDRADDMNDPVACGPGLPKVKQSALALCSYDVLMPLMLRRLQRPTTASGWLLGAGGAFRPALCRCVGCREVRFCIGRVSETAISD